MCPNDRLYSVRVFKVVAGANLRKIDFELSSSVGCACYKMENAENRFEKYASMTKLWTFEICHFSQQGAPRNDLNFALYECMHRSAT